MYFIESHHKCLECYQSIPYKYHSNPWNKIRSILPFASLLGNGFSPYLPHSAVHPSINLFVFFLASVIHFGSERQITPLSRIYIPERLLGPVPPPTAGPPLLRCWGLPAWPCMWVRKLSGTRRRAGPIPVGHICRPRMHMNPQN